MLGGSRSGKSMSVFLHSQEADSDLLGHRSESSTTRSISSTQSPRKWYHRTLDRFISRPSSRRQPSLHPGSPSIKELSKKRSHSLLNTAFNHPYIFSKQQEDLPQRNESLVQLPGTPGGQSCRPLRVIAHEHTLSSLDLFTPDQSGISSDSGGPVTPRATESVYSLPIFTKNVLGQVMGNSDSKVTHAKVSKIIRKPVSGLLRRKKSQQIEATEDTAEPPLPQEPTARLDSAPAPEPAPEPVPSVEPAADSATTQLEQPEKENTSPAGESQELHRHVSAGQPKVPRRRSSLTAIHLDSSHFEKPLSSTDLGSSKRYQRAASFSESFEPVVKASGSTTAVPSPEPQENENLGDHQSARRLPLPPSNRRPSDAGSSTSQTRPAQVRFPETWPHGAPTLKPAPLTQMHYNCSRSHKFMIRERAMFNQIPCMTCAIDDKEARYTCQWCELRLCDPCMKQLASNRGRPLGLVTEWVADKIIPSRQKQSMPNMKRAQSKETLKQKKSADVLPAMRKPGRSGSMAPSVDTVRDKVKPGQLDSQEGQRKAEAFVDHSGGEGTRSPVERVKSAGSVKSRTQSDHHNDSKQF